MNAPRILVPEDKARVADQFARDQRRSLVRACTASALAAAAKRPAESVLKAAWPDDHTAAILLKAASSPTDTSGFPGLTGVAALQHLAPASVALQLFDRALKVNLDGIASVKVPFVATPPTASFVAEAGPAPPWCRSRAGNFHCARPQGRQRPLLVLAPQRRALCKEYGSALNHS
jgi:hypothetical protein